jgi:hypothetical protein
MAQTVLLNKNQLSDSDLIELGRTFSFLMTDDVFRRVLAQLATRGDATPVLGEGEGAKGDRSATAAYIKTILTVNSLLSLSAG